MLFLALLPRASKYGPFPTRQLQNLSGFANLFYPEKQRAVWGPFSAGLGFLIPNIDVSIWGSIGRRNLLDLKVRLATNKFSKLLASVVARIK